jgi:hypothetical protein
VDLIFRIVLFLVGCGIVIATYSSIITTIILPRRVSSVITYISWLAVLRTFLFLVDRRSTFEAKDRVMAFLGPVSILTTLLGWVALFLLGYGLMFWSVEDTSLGSGVWLSGSSLFTLGVTSSPHIGAVVVEFMAAATGLVAVALQVGYLPTLYGAYNRRETLVTALSSRAGAPAWGPEILARHHLNRTVATLPALYAAWEIWAADIMESHASYPWLMAFRSPNPKHSWILGLLAMLDSAAMYLALSPSQAPAEARLFLRMGYVAVRELGSAAGMQVNHDPLPTDPIRLSYEEFAEAVAELQHIGFPLERTAADAWPSFRGWRVNYEEVTYEMIDFLVTVPAPWSGTRTRVQAPVPRLHEIRPPHRTPDDPEGSAALTTFAAGVLPSEAGTSLQRVTDQVVDELPGGPA